MSGVLQCEYAASRRVGQRVAIGSPDDDDDPSVRHVHPCSAPARTRVRKRPVPCLDLGGSPGARCGDAGVLLGQAAVLARSRRANGRGIGHHKFYMRCDDLETGEPTRARS